MGERLIPIALHAATDRSPSAPADGRASTSAFPMRASAVSLTLTARAAGIADLVARVVARLHSADPNAVATVTFLRSWVEQARAAAPAGALVPGTVTPREPHPLDALTATLGLGEAERDLVLLAGLADEHEGLAGTLRSLHPLGEPRPTVGLAALVLAETGVDRDELRRLLGAGPAARGGVLRIIGDTGLFERSLLLADGLWEALHGVEATPSGLRVIDPGPPPAGLDGWLGDDLVCRAARVITDGEPATVVLAAAEERISLARCAAILGRAGARPFAVRTRPGDDLAEVARQVIPHAAARGAVPVLVPTPGTIGPTADETRPPPGSGELGELPGPMILCAARGSTRLDGPRPVLVLPVDGVGPDDCRLAWRAMLPGVDDAGAAELAARLPLDPAWVAVVARDVRLAGAESSVSAASAALRRRTGAVLPPGVELITPDVPWERLILPEDAALQLRDAVDRLTHQGTVLDDWGMGRTARAHRGARLLLTGMPGTGKSLAAEALATAAHTDLMRVDLSQIVSKWLGETEKNLAATFDAAERTQSVPLLDEADALFGNRTEISDAHDRYANLETAYLLQRLDSFDGLLVLTTNLRHNIDTATLRRMDFVIELPLPDETSRRALWALHLPAGHVAVEVDLDVLARMYPVPGGWIRNASLAAAFAAAAESSSAETSGMQQQHLIAAVRREYAKAALPFPGEPPRRRDDN